MLAWCGADRVIHSYAVDGIEAGLERLASLCVEEKPSPLGVWLGGAVCRLERVAAIEGVRSKSEAEEACTAMLQARGAGPAQKAQLPFWPYGLSHWCVAAMDAAVLKQLQEIRGVRLSIKPWWSWAAEHFMAGPGQHADQSLALAMFDGESVVACDWDANGTLAAAATAAPVTDVDAANRFITRRAAGSAQGGSPCVLTLSLRFDDRESKQVSKSDFAFQRLVSMTYVA